MDIRIYYEDTDCGGIVYHANYIKFCERARSEYFFAKGELPENEQCNFVVRHIDANYLAPAVLGDLIHVHTQTKEVKNTSVVVHHKIFNQDQLLFEMTAVLVCVKEGKAIRIPEEMRSKLHWSF